MYAPEANCSTSVSSAGRLGQESGSFLWYHAVAASVGRCVVNGRSLPVNGRAPMLTAGKMRITPPLFLPIYAKILRHQVRNFAGPGSCSKRGIDAFPVDHGVD